MTTIGTAQGMISLILSLAILGMEVFAFVDALRHRADAYVAALFALWGDNPLLSGIGNRLAAAGRLSLTNYIGASIVMIMCCVMCRPTDTCE